jgi:hypothetical protein|nr:DUF2509 family protein [Intestinirhabdus alba]
MVLLLLALGALLLQGTSQQAASYASRAAAESRGLQRQAAVQSALEWGRTQRWSTSDAVRCREAPTSRARVCLRLLAGGEALLMARYETAALWRLGRVDAGRILFSPRGWSDFCPLREVALCLMP